MAVCGTVRIEGVYIWLGRTGVGGGQQGEPGGLRVKLQREREKKRERSLHRLQTPHRDSATLKINTHGNPTPPDLTVHAGPDGVRGGASVSWRW